MIQAPPAPLPEVIVTAARLPPAAGEAAFSVVRLGDESLGRALRLDEALATVPAVSLFRRTSSLAANPTTQGISLRAIAPSGAGRTLVTLDGVPLNDPFGGWVIWSRVAPESLSGLDIVRGAGAGPYGAGALTGVIALRERDDKDSVLDAGVSSRGGRRVAGSATADLGPVRLVASGLYDTSDGYVPVRGDQAGAADTPLDLDARSAALRADVPLGDAALSLRASTWEEDRGSGLAGARANASGSSLSATLARQPAADRAGWRLQAWQTRSNLTNGFVAVAADRSATTAANDQVHTPATGQGLNAALRRTGVAIAGGRLEWELGLDARSAEGETNEQSGNFGSGFTRSRRAGGETSVAGAYGEGAWRGSDWLLAGGLRLDHWTSENGRRLERSLTTGLTTLDETDPDRSGTVTSARFAVRRELGRDYAVRAATYSSFRPATLNELYRPFRVGNDLTEANAALVPERLTGIEAGLSHTGDDGGWTVTLFRNVIEDAIVNVTIGAGPGTFPRAGFVPAGGVLRQRQNAGTVAATGLELTGDRQLWTHLRLRGAVSVTDARLDGGNQAPQLTGLRPAQAPIWSATAGLDWQASSRLTLAGTVQYESRRFDDDLNSRTLAAATTLGLRADWVIAPGMIVWLAAENLFDADVEVAQTATGVTGFGPPRSVGVGLRLTR
ncbi:TonB-dependent receptor [uncultured Brevundimonas sp.]|uniref:TonB-dependent receptor n=1 Tax=uncultured Brevundimonas sp. TaxID=213418 RepID=UPI0030ED59DD|tara:strand:- start:1730 stop:3748 length:2019 start_codon:yes stop_codon:yes gene_type:complete